VQVWACHPTGLSDQTDKLTGPQLLTLRYRNFAEVRVETDQPLAMVDENRVAIKVKLPRFHDDTVSGCVDRDAARLV